MTFDENGNLTHQTDVIGTTNYIWDAKDRLVGISRAGFSATFIYDALGRRLHKNINKLQTDYQYDGHDIIQEFSDNSVGATYVRTFKIDEPLVRHSSSDEYFHADVLGSVLAITDQDGTIREAYTYEPFGNTTTGDASSNSFQFTGRENDRTGLYYYRARYYSSTLQRFISEDPREFSGGDYNLYGYVRNAPLQHGDPFGLFILPIVALPTTAIPGSNIPVPTPQNSAIPLPFITYGNFGGKGWTAGWTGEGSPIDSLDECFKSHDECYGRAEIRRCETDETINSCDVKLVECMGKLAPDPRHWQNPAPHPRWANLYRRAADWYFR
jgi:RHS repeat-associated protein